MPIPEDIAEDFIKDAGVMQTHELSKKYGKSLTVVKDWRRELYREGRLEDYPHRRIGPKRKKEFVDHIVIEGDVVVICDLEVPYQDEEVVSLAVAIGKKMGIRTLVVAGDFMANDALSTWPTEDGDETSGMTSDLRDAEEVILELFKWFTAIYIIKGNHEQRATRKRELEYLELLRLIWGRHGKLVLSEYKWCRVISGGRETQVEHPSTYRTSPGSLPRARAEVENVDVLSGHTHHMSMTFTRDGRHQAGEIGHGTNEELRYYYKVNGTTPHPKWVRGFAVIRNGYKYWFPIDFTDWDFWLKEVQIEGGKDV